MALQPIVDLGRLFSFLIVYKVGRIPWTGISPPQVHYLHTERYKHRIIAHRHPSFEWDSKPTIPVFERAKAIISLDRVVTVIVILFLAWSIFLLHRRAKCRILPQSQFCVFRNVMKTTEPKQTSHCSFYWTQNVHQNFTTIITLKSCK
jgi:hypothetical protein